MAGRKGLHALRKEWRALERRELRYALRAEQVGWQERKAAWQEKIPPKARTALEAAFAKAFALVFEKGTGAIERTYRRDQIESAHADRTAAFETDGGRRPLRQVRRDGRAAEARGLLATTVEGVGLGLLGIGLPDVVLLVAMLLRGVYTTALRYGCSYEGPRERLLILRVMEASVSRGEDWRRRNAAIDAMLDGGLPEPTAEELDRQTRATAQAFATELLVLKFVQGLPLVGVVGGLADPVYLRRVTRYATLKYQRRYLLALREKGEREG